ncbi:MAG: exodeoxyribonuclease VII small subunit [Arenicella sp.]|jgi:exodeoxyribonuclease VII small subunit|nr:exodeoxyribonuclease VII small subunit [Arenicella sp.]HAU68849.1 exodeoxyribonuclease VII small subunit [Gammaproteobacteria bacterium]
MSKTNETKTDLTFEQAFNELEALVERMERGQQNLEDSLGDFERGVGLMKHCHSVLKSAEQQVEILVKDSDGLFVTKALEPSSSDS